MYRVVQWATGAMGRTALRRVLDHPDLELVGVYVYGKEKVGRDAGEIARRPTIGVRATSRIEDVLELRPDVVIHTPRIASPYKRPDDDVIRLLAGGINVISTAGLHYPDAHGPAYAGPLRAACLAGNSTLAGLGLNPGFVAERLAVMLTGMCAQLSRIATYEIADASGMKSPEFVFKVMGFGTDPATTDVTRGPLTVRNDPDKPDFRIQVTPRIGIRQAADWPLRFVIEGNPQMMWESLLKLRALPDDTRVFCGHEYTAANIRFAKTIEPDNALLLERDREVTKLVAAKTMTIPSLMGEEKATNPFLRADIPEVAKLVGLPGKSAWQVFAEIRERKNKF